MHGFAELHFHVAKRFAVSFNPQMRGFVEGQINHVVPTYRRIYGQTHGIDVDTVRLALRIGLAAQCCGLASKAKTEVDTVALEVGLHIFKVGSISFPIDNRLACLVNPLYAAVDCILGVQNCRSHQLSRPR